LTLKQEKLRRISLHPGAMTHFQENGYVYVVRNFEQATLNVKIEGLHTKGHYCVMKFVKPIKKIEELENYWIHSGHFSFGMWREKIGYLMIPEKDLYLYKLERVENISV
jgi:hypothetical protein